MKILDVKNRILKIDNKRKTLSPLQTLILAKLANNELLTRKDLWCSDSTLARTKNVCKEMGLTIQVKHGIGVILLDTLYIE